MIEREVGSDTATGTPTQAGRAVPLPEGLADDPVVICLLGSALPGDERDRLLSVIREGWGYGRRPLVALLHAGWAFEDIEASLSGMRGDGLVDLNDYQADTATLTSIGIQVARRMKILPIESDGSRRLVAVAEPDDLATKDFVFTHFGGSGSVHLVRAAADDIDEAISSIERSAAAVELSAVANRAASDEYGDLEDDPDVTEALSEGPHLQLINSIFERAVESHASDIHFTPAGDQLRISMRVDGVLFDVSQHPRKLAERVVQALKQLARVSLVERRLPQDGTLPHHLPNGRQLEMRASFLPGQYGLEKVTLRIVDRSKGVTHLDALGLSLPVYESLVTALRSSYGVLLMAGPTGSGKTTTLYAALDSMNDGKRNILTVEDPVEITIPGVHQVSVNPDIGLTFGSLLSKFLRADPDVMLVGEIRDIQTAETAIQAAQTGHLVLSTIHTNTASAAATRLGQMGVEGYAISAGLIGVMNQRLIRKLCITCRESDDGEYTGFDWGEAGRPDMLWKPHSNGCPRCNNLGFSGRTPVAEILIVNEPIRDAITSRSSVFAIEQLAKEQGMIPMTKDAISKVASGITSMSEYAAFVGADF